VAALKQQEEAVAAMLMNHLVPTVALSDLQKVQFNLNFDPCEHVLGFNFTFCFHCFDSEIFNC
jgi:hypothetical protein